MSKIKPPTKKPKTASGAVGFLIAILFLSAVGSVLSDSQASPQPYGLVMGFMWGSAFASFFVMWMLYYARFILPRGDSSGWEDGFHLSIRHYLTQAGTYLNSLSEKASNRKETRERRSVAQQPAKSRPYPESFDHLDAGVMKSYHVLAINEKGVFSRGAGPGVVILKRKENIVRVLDMRRHLRRQTVEAMTSDGIAVKTDVIVIFHINTDTHGKNRKLLYSYDEDDIFRISYATSVDEQYGVNHWNDHIAPQAAALMADALSTYTLDELRDVHSNTLPTIYKTVQTNLEAQLSRMATVSSSNDENSEQVVDDNSGITITAVSTSNIEEPERIQEQRLHVWQMNIQEEINTQTLTRQAQSTQEIQRMRARAQVDIINNIIQSIQAMYDSHDVSLSEIITLRMVEALEEAMANESSMAMTPETLTHWVMDTIEQLRGLLDDGEKNGRDE